MKRMYGIFDRPLRTFDCTELFCTVFDPTCPHQTYPPRTHLPTIFPFFHFTYLYLKNPEWRRPRRKASVGKESPHNHGFNTAGLVRTGRVPAALERAAQGRDIRRRLIRNILVARPLCWTTALDHRTASTPLTKQGIPHTHTVGHKL